MHKAPNLLLLGSHASDGPVVIMGEAIIVRLEMLTSIQKGVLYQVQWHVQLSC